MSALASKYGATFGGLTLAPQGMPATGGSNGAVAAAGIGHGKLDVDNPMVWLVGIGAITLGLIAANTSFRVGPVRASVHAGKS